MSLTKVKINQYNWRGIIGYALYDWASSPVPTLHATFIFAYYFTMQIAPENGATYWMYMTSLASLTTAILAPFLGSYADAKNRRKTMLFLFTIIGVLSTGALWIIFPDKSYMLDALIISFCSIVAMELTFVFYNSLLTSVAMPHQIGKVSGISWGFGYFGANICLILALYVFVENKNPPFSLNIEEFEHVRATMILAAIWLLIFSMPIFLLISENNKQNLNFSPLKRLKEGFKILLKIPGLPRFLLARMLYTDGLTVVFAAAGIYAGTVFGFPLSKVIILGIVVNVFCGIGAITGGIIEDKIGPFKTIRFSLYSLLILGIGILLSPTELWFWIFALLVGIFIGPVQSSSRSLFAQSTPEKYKSQLFGFYMFAGKSTSFIGPAIYGWLVLTAKDLGFEEYSRAGMLIVLLFFIAGIIILGSKGPSLKNDS